MILKFLYKKPFKPLWISIIFGIWLFIYFIFYAFSIPNLFEEPINYSNALLFKLLTAVCVFISGLIISSNYLWNSRNKNKHIEMLLGLILLFIQYFIFTEAIFNIIGYYFNFHPNIFLNDDFSGMIEVLGFIGICGQYIFRYPKSIWQFINWAIDSYYHLLPGVSHNKNASEKEKKEGVLKHDFSIKNLIPTFFKLIFIILTAYAVKSLFG